MSFPVYPTRQYLNQLDAIRVQAYPPAPNRAKVHLYKNNIPPDPGMTLAIFQEADYLGYAPVDILLSEPTLNDQGISICRSNLIEWQSESETPTQEVYGIYITDASGVNLIAAQQFDLPQVMGGTFPQAISGIWRITNPQTNIGWISVEG